MTRTLVFALVVILLVVPLASSEPCSEPAREVVDCATRVMVVSATVSEVLEAKEQIVAELLEVNNAALQEFPIEVRTIVEERPCGGHVIGTVLKAMGKAALKLVATVIEQMV